MAAGVVRWKFRDLASGAVWQVPVNPATASDPRPARSVSTTGSAHPQGRVFAREGARVPKDWTFDGDIVERSHHDALLAWADRGARVEITTHRGLRVVVVPRQCEMTEVPAYETTIPWRYRYSFVGAVLKVTEAAA